MIFSPDKPISVLRAGLLCRCPQCGKGSIYIGYLKVVEKLKGAQTLVKHRDDRELLRVIQEKGIESATSRKTPNW